MLLLNCQWVWLSLRLWLLLLFLLCIVFIYLFLLYLSLLQHQHFSGLGLCYSLLGLKSVFSQSWSSSIESVFCAIRCAMVWFRASTSTYLNRRIGNCWIVKEIKIHKACIIWVTYVVTVVVSSRCSCAFLLSSLWEEYSGSSRTWLDSESFA